MTFRASCPRGLIIFCQKPMPTSWIPSLAGMTSCYNLAGKYCSPKVVRNTKAFHPKHYFAPFASFAVNYSLSEDNAHNTGFLPAQE